MSPRWFTVPGHGGPGEPLTGSVIIPAGLIDIMRQRLEQDRVDAIAAADGPLSPDDRKVLEEGLLRAQEEYAVARDRLRAVNARLAGQARATLRPDGGNAGRPRAPAGASSPAPSAP